MGPEWRAAEVLCPRAKLASSEFVSQMRVHRQGNFVGRGGEALIAQFDDAIKLKLLKIVRDEGQKLLFGKVH